MWVDYREMLIHFNFHVIDTSSSVFYTHRYLAKYAGEEEVNFMLPIINFLLGQFHTLHASSNVVASLALSVGTCRGKIFFFFLHGDFPRGQELPSANSSSHSLERSGVSSRGLLKGETQVGWKSRFCSAESEPALFWSREEGRP